ncbi:hypothetical protein FB451DRAFT_1389269 [Mycena latifolia]|nr:hypothetical protein FB451DRAFT_1389269 [Mycena latifolia]
MEEATQLTVTILLGLLTLIPDNTLRYAALEITGCVAVIYVISLKRPSAQLRHLKETIEDTDGIIRGAQLQCPRDHLNLAEETVRLLEQVVKPSASMITCRILETERFTWKKYWLVSRDIGECAKSAQAISTTIQLTVEAERRRKLAEDINEIEGMLATIRGYNTFWTESNALTL